MQIKLICLGLASVCVLVGSAAQTQIPTTDLELASKSLNGRNQCVPFMWEAGLNGSKRGAMTIPVSINGEALRFQLDTGANTNVMYGSVADKRKWAQATDHSFRPATIRIAGNRFRRPSVLIMRDMKAGRVSGTLGLPNLVGKISVIDYPRQRFCLFNESDIPKSLSVGLSARASLHNGKLFLPLNLKSQVGQFVFDTGSSEFPLSADLSVWTNLTGITDPTKAPDILQGSAWGKPISFYGAPVNEELFTGHISLGRPIIYVNASAPNGFADWPFKADGVIGNASFWNGIVVLDLTDEVIFRYIS